MGYTIKFNFRSLEKGASPSGCLYLLKIENRKRSYKSLGLPRLREEDWDEKRQRVKKHDHFKQMAGYSNGHFSWCRKWRHHHTWNIHPRGPCVSLKLPSKFLSSQGILVIAFILNSRRRQLQFNGNKHYSVLHNDTI